jgi:hypothetical protein
MLRLPSHSIAGARESLLDAILLARSYTMCKTAVFLFSRLAIGSAKVLLGALEGKEEVLGGESPEFYARS